MKILKKDLKEVYKQSSVKDGLSEGFFNVFIFRKISIYFSWVFASFDISPNKITFFSFIMNLGAAYWFFLGGYPNNVLGLVFYFFASILDMSDGEVARLTNRKSKFGAFLDPFLDRVSDVILVGAIIHGYYLVSSQGSLLIYLYVVFLIITYLSLYIDNKVNGEGNNSTVNNLRRITKFISNIDLRKYIKWDRGFSCALIACLVVFNKLFLFVLILLLKDLFLFIFTFKGLASQLRRGYK
ncbi:MAG: CDP-alcohol phosphatidyltransferase family protein [Patescibacteria group bacterium]